MCKILVQSGRPQMTIAQAHCVMDTQVYKHTLRICNNCFSTAPMVARTRLNVTLYVDCLSRLVLQLL